MKRTTAFPNILIDCLTAVLLAPFAALHAGAIEPPSHLLCEYLADPAAIDSARPRLSWWVMAGDARDVRQAAYQIVVASDAELLTQEKGNLWDSGKIAADVQEVAYDGKPLASRQRCFWKVRVWDGAGRASAWSAPARWSMGLLEAKDWTGRWIGAADDVPAVGPQPGVMLRREWRVKGPVVRAQLSICGLGWHEVYLNGRKVGDAVLEPGWTDFDKRVSYVTHDVTGLLREGPNAMGVVLGGGYFNFATPTILLLDTIRWRMTPRALVDLEIIYADGSREVVAGDGRWQSSVAGPITFNCVRAGEYKVRGAFFLTAGNTWENIRYKGLTHRDGVGGRVPRLKGVEFLYGTTHNMLLSEGHFEDEHCTLILDFAGQDITGRTERLASRSSPQAGASSEPRGTWKLKNSILAVINAPNMKTAADKPGTVMRFGELPVDLTLANCVLTYLGDVPEAAGKAGEDYVFAAPEDIFAANPGTGDYRFKPDGIAGQTDVGYRPGRPPVYRPIADRIAAGFGYD